MMSSPWGQGNGEGKVYVRKDATAANLDVHFGGAVLCLNLARYSLPMNDQ